tara:strand:+ start:1784 stop:2374 length:591 start_codon:yes stop_codon:yes gene_type:complete
MLNNKYKMLNYIIKEVKGEKFNIYKRFNMFINEDFRFYWGFSHISDLHYKIKCLFKRHDLIRTRLARTKYHDKPELMLYGIMNMLVDFVETEKCFDTIDFNGGNKMEGVRETIIEVYNWWRDRPNREKEMSVALDNWYNHTSDELLFAETPRKILKPSSIQAKRYSDIHNHLEAALLNEDNEMLDKVLAIREHLWT